MIDSADLRLVAAIAREGGPRRAADALGMHVATVYRQLHRLEKALGLALFEQVDDRYMATPFANELVEAAAALQATLDALERRAAGADEQLAGTLAVTTTDTLMPLVCAAIRPFCAAHAGLSIVLTMSNAMADMMHQEADIAIRPTRSPPETLIGRRVGDIAFAPYRPAEDVDAWIGFDQSLAAIPVAVWAAERLPPPRLRFNSLWGIAQGVAAGLGRAVLPTYLARGLPIEPYGDPIAELHSSVWMLYHPNLRRTPRVRTFVREVAPILARMLRES